MSLFRRRPPVLGEYRHALDSFDPPPPRGNDGPAHDIHDADGDPDAGWGSALRPGPVARMFIPPEVAAERGWLVPPAPAFPEGLQLDLACLLGRLKQIEREGCGETPHWLMDRVLSRDLPRMVKYLTPETLARLRMTDADGYWTPEG